MSFDTIVNIAIFAAALVLMVRFGCGRHMMGHAHSAAHAGARGDASSARHDAIDPVCGMSVDKGSARSASFEGRAFYFCSDSCRRTFEASPADYAVKAVAAPANASQHRHGCC